MKKKYCTPALHVTEIVMEGMMAASIDRLPISPDPSAPAVKDAGDWNNIW